MLLAHESRLRPWAHRGARHRPPADAPGRSL